MIDVTVDGTIPTIDTERIPKAMEEIRELMYQSVRQNFLSGGRPAWAPRKHSYPWPILRKTGFMFESIQRESAANYAEVWMPDEVRYAKYHQDGTKKMAMRPFMMFQDSDYDDILNIVMKNLILPVTLTGPTSSIGDSK